MHSTKIVALVLAVSVGACGSGGDEGANSAAAGNAAQTAASNAGPIDPCSLLTLEEVSKAIGEEVIAKRPGEGSCTYETADPESSSVRIELAESDAAGRMNSARRTEGALEDASGVSLEDGAVAGEEMNVLGADGFDRFADEAFFDVETNLNVRKGYRYLKVAPPVRRLKSGDPTLSKEERQRIAMEIAQTALQRMQ